MVGADIPKNWLTDKIKRGIPIFSIGEFVIVFRRKRNGHPKALEDGVVYIVEEFNGERLGLRTKDPSATSWAAKGYLARLYWVHYSYVTPVHIYREKKFEDFFKAEENFLEENNKNSEPNGVK